VPESIARIPGCLHMDDAAAFGHRSSRSRHVRLVPKMALTVRLRELYPMIVTVPAK
jgi:hypothetical protein